jgi:hypothetical protein
MGQSATKSIGTAQKHGAGWKAPSSCGVGDYFVTLNPPRCTCPAWRYGHGQECNHIRELRRRVERQD